MASWGCQHVAPSRDTLVHKRADAVELHLSHDRSNVDGFVERRPDTKCAHAVLDFCNQRFGNALLHQEARSGTTNLALIEPDSVDEAFDRTVEIGVFEHDEGRLAAKFQGKTFMTRGGGGADRASNFRRSGERDLIDVGMLDQCLAGYAVSGNNVDDSGRQARFLTDSSEREGGERCEFSRLQDDSVSSRKGRGDFPRQHQ